MRPRGPYITSWEREFYTTYQELVPKNNKNQSKFRSLRLVIEIGRKLECDNNHINIVLAGRCTLNSLLRVSYCYIFRRH